MVRFRYQKTIASKGKKGIPMFSARKFLAVTLGGAALSLLAVVPANAQTLTAIQQGWFTNFGEHNSGNSNYFAGNSSGFAILRNFFTFDLTGISSMITGATFQIYNPSNGFRSGDSTETYSFGTTSANSVQLASSYGSGSVAGQGIYNALGSGTAIGSLVVSSASNNQTLSLSFNAAGISYLNSNLGSKVSFGGQVTSISGSGDQFIFGFSGGNQPTLSLQTASNLTPESDGIWLFLPALLPVAFLMYKRRRSLQSV
jgi:hypothetical protein